MTNTTARRLGVFASAALAGGLLSVVPAGTASAATYGYHASAPTQGECTGKLGAVKAQWMREGRNITFLRNCYRSAGGFYQGEIRYTVKDNA